MYTIAVISSLPPHPGKYRNPVPGDLCVTVARPPSITIFYYIHGRTTSTHIIIIHNTQVCGRFRCTQSFPFRCTAMDTTEVYRYYNIVYVKKKPQTDVCGIRCNYVHSYFPVAVFYKIILYSDLDPSPYCYYYYYYCLYKMQCNRIDLFAANDYTPTGAINNSSRRGSLISVLYNLILYIIWYLRRRRHPILHLHKSNPPLGFSTIRECRGRLFNIISM